TSGSLSSTSVAASPPSEASPTTRMSSCRSRNSRRPRRTTSWSSAMTTRIGPAKLHLHLHCGSCTGFRVDLERASERFDALAHRRQAETSRAGDRLLGVEAAAVVGHSESRARVADVERKLHVSGTTVTKRVAKRLLRDAEQRLLDIWGQRAIALHLQLDVLLVQPPEDVDMLPQSSGEPLG